MKKIGIAFFCFQNIGQVHSYFRMRKKVSHVKFTSREDIFDRLKYMTSKGNDPNGFKTTNSKRL